MKCGRARSVAALVLWVLPGLIGATLAVEKGRPAWHRRFEVHGWFKSSFLVMPEDVAEAARDGKRLLVYFGQEDCPYCAQLFKNIFSQVYIVKYTR